MTTSPRPPLSSLTPEYIHAYNGHALTVTAIVFTILELLFVFLRYLSKSVGRVPFGVDDWLLVPALICCLGLNASALAALKVAGLGHHTVVLEDTDPHKVALWQQFLIVIPILYSAAVGVSKVAILVFYSRIFVTKWQRIATWTIMGFVIATAVADIITTGFQCIPLQRFWDRTIPGHCFNYNMFYRYGSLPNPISDILMLALPIPVVWGLRSSLKVKIGLTFTFLTGSIGLIAAILRTYAFFRRNALGDATYSGAFLFVWIVLEPGCYLIASCLVCLRPLLNFVTGRSVDSTTRRTNSVSGIRRPFSSNRRGSVPSEDRGIPLIRRDIEFTVTPHDKMAAVSEEKEDEETLVGDR